MVEKCMNQEHGDMFSLYNGDCVEVLGGMPGNSVDLTVFSPPFTDLYCYSDSERDMGNCKDWDAFFTQFGFLVDQLLRVTKPGRQVVVHCMDLPVLKERDGYIGMRDFSGALVQCFMDRGFIWHSPRVTIWKDPLIEATRTKALGLMHKQLQKDSAMSRTGIPDYLVVFRAPGENAEPVAHPDGLMKYAGSTDPGGHGVKRSHNIWRAYASPVWMDIRQTRTLNRKGAREENDEKHICPLQLDVIDRCLVLWSNKGDTVLTPFGGIGSEAYCAVSAGRRAVLVELKESYYRQAVKNLEGAQDVETEDMFGMGGGVTADKEAAPEEGGDDAHQAQRDPTTD